MIYDSLVSFFDYQYGVVIVGILLIIIMVVIWKYILNRPLFNKDFMLMLSLLTEISFPDGRSFYKFFKSNIATTNFIGDAKILTGEFSETTCEIANTCLEKGYSVSLITGPHLKADRIEQAKLFISSHKNEIENNKLKIFVSKIYEDKHFVLFPNYLYIQKSHLPGATRNFGWGKKIGRYSLSRIIYTKRFESIDRNEIKVIDDLDKHIHQVE
jgi:hypothetical protein